MAGRASGEAGAPYLSVIIPAYQEERRIGATLVAVGEHLARRGYESEIVVVDDGSTDGTAGVVRSKMDASPVPIRLLGPRSNRGKGYSVREGLLAARGAYRLFSDADLATPIDELDRMLQVAHTRRADVVIASRALPESKLVVRQPWYRETMGRIFNLLVRWAGLTECPDTQCGFKLLTARAVDEVVPWLTIDGFGFDVELLWVALVRDLRVWQLPVRWIDSPASRVSPVTDASRMFVDLLRVRINDWRGIYERQS
jgi:dolichyl-phosphate beta-glucosyltransferase